MDLTPPNYLKFIHLCFYLVKIKCHEYLQEIRILLMALH